MLGANQISRKKYEDNRDIAITQTFTIMDPMTREPKAHTLSNNLPQFAELQTDRGGGQSRSQTAGCNQAFFLRGGWVGTAGGRKLSSKFLWSPGIRRGVGLGACVPGSRSPGNTKKPGGNLYRFETADAVYTFIDTPGIGDTSKRFLRIKFAAPFIQSY